MDLELTDEQRWLSESVQTLLARTSPDRVWSALVEFGALSIGRDGLGAVELCLIAQVLGTHLASVPFIGSAAARLALPDDLIGPDEAIALALLEPSRRWLDEEPGTTLANGALDGEKVAIEHAGDVDLLAVSASHDGAPVLVLVEREAAGVITETRASFDPSIPFGAASFNSAAAVSAVAGAEAIDRLKTIGALLAAAEAIGCAGALLELARRYAAERRQFGHTIGSFQSLRHLLADMYVRQASGWSTVLYAAAAFDDAADDAHTVASVAKAYVSRVAREVAHDAMQVFGGIAFTAEHPAHRFLRRIIVREQQFGDAAEHERALGRALALRLTAERAR